MSLSWSRLQRCGRCPTRLMLRRDIVGAGYCSPRCSSVWPQSPRVRTEMGHPLTGEPFRGPPPWYLRQEEPTDAVVVSAAIFAALCRADRTCEASR